MKNKSFENKTINKNNNLCFIKDDDDSDKKQILKISDRITQIKKMLMGKIFESMIDFDNENNIVDNRTHDICEIINKKDFNIESLAPSLGSNLIYVKSGSTGHTFKGTLTDQDFEYAMKIVPYEIIKNYGDHNEKNRPENSELLMLKLLSNFVLEKKTPHIILPIATFNVKFSFFDTLIKKCNINNDKCVQLLKKFSDGKYHNNVSILISEWANNGDLLDYLRKNYKILTLQDWRTILFQLLMTLAIIHEKYPAFRHNDLKANNLLVYKNKNENQNSYLYKLDKQYFVTPYIGIQIKLWDFDFACIPGIVDNIKVNLEWTKKINITPTQNRYYDIHYFFNTLTKKGFLPQIYESQQVPVKVKQFFRRVVPEHLSKGDIVTERGRILINEEYTTPKDLLLNDIFFEKFRIKLKNLKIKK